MEGSIELLVDEECQHRDGNSRSSHSASSSSVAPAFLDRSVIASIVFVTDKSR